MLYSLKRSLAAAALSFVLLPAVHAQQSPAPLSPQDRARIETQLKAARERLEDAAREVGQLSGKLTGPIGYDYLISSQLRQKGAELGVTIDDDEEGARKDGVKVESVIPRGPADKAGIKEDDVIVALNGKSLKDAKPSAAGALIEQMKEVKPGEKVKVELLRDGRKQTVEVIAQPHAANVFGMYYPPRPGADGRIGPDLAEAQRRARELSALRFNTFDPPGDRNTRVFNQFFGGGMLDMELVSVTPKLGHYFGVDSGLLIVKPPRDSGIKLEEGDVIVDIDGRKPQDSAHAMRILRSYQPGEQVTFGVMRDRKAIKVPVEMPRAGIDVAGPQTRFHSYFTPPAPAPEVPPAPPEPPAPPKFD